MYCCTIKRTIYNRPDDSFVLEVLDEQQVKTGFSEEGDAIVFLQTVLENDQIISITFK